MPRPFPWLPRTARIRSRVSNSVRSHYTRRDLELLFEVSPRAAGRLLELLATEPVGTAHMVSREVLSDFLERVAQAESVPAACTQIRAERKNLTRVKARYRCLKDQGELLAASLPDSIQLEPGRLTITFDSIETMFQRLWQLNVAMDCDPLGIEQLCDPPVPVQDSAEAEDRRELDRIIREMEADPVNIEKLAQHRARVAQNAKKGGPDFSGPPLLALAAEAGEP